MGHVTDTIDAPQPTEGAAKRRAGGLNAMLVADLKTMAASLGVAGGTGMKKAQLIEAIRAAQSGNQSGTAPRPAADRGAASSSSEAPAEDGKSAGSARKAKSEGAKSKAGGAKGKAQDGDGKSKGKNKRAETSAAPADAEAAPGASAQPTEAPSRRRTRSREDNREDNRDANAEPERRAEHPGEDPERSPEQLGDGDQDGRSGQRRDDETGSTRRNRRRRGRERDRAERPQQQPQQQRAPRAETDISIFEDDVLVPAAGILDVLDNYAFVRTSGYLPGSDDVYLSLSLVRKYGLRRGDAVVGQVRQPREGERREKFNPMVRIDLVNGIDPEIARNRVEFGKLTPLYPDQRLRLETGPDNVIGRLIDLTAPIGKGQRGLIVSPPNAGRTMILQSIANSITTNNPECHLMVVLVDERPEEVTDFQRSVKGEVISSTFDRPAGDHTSVAELAIERAKRLVELGHDVVVLLDGITRLGRAYNLSSSGSGRSLPGGVDAAALYPPKRFFGAARNIENGGSLTIVATALIESGSTMDELIFEEFQGTGNMELRLSRGLADKRVFPAIDVVSSSTRREELLLSQEELAIIRRLRRQLAGLDEQQALEFLLERLGRSQTNIEFLLQVQQS